MIILNFMNLKGILHDEKASDRLYLSYLEQILF